MANLVGRDKERALLERLHKSGRPEFLAVYGRRRIGKTFLITESFRDRGVFFEVTGSPNASTREQLLNFHREYCALFKTHTENSPPKTWSEALHRLATTCEELPKAERIILFFDELPWLASPRSGFLSALDYFWNRHASRIPNIFLIVCGSAASWMINKVINNRAGLYGRLSAHMRLLPFTLSETEAYLSAQSIHLPRQQTCELYMALGGVPKYLSYIPRGLSTRQIIDQLCFTPQAPMLTEFHILFSSLFDHSERHMQVVEALAEAGQGGLSRQRLVSRLSTGGQTSLVLRELEESGFITASKGVTKRTGTLHYRLADEYSLFYLTWIDNVKSLILQSSERGYWLRKHGTPSWNSWAGKAFEALCLKHIVPIKSALGIGGVLSTEGQWAHQAPKGGKGSGAQIDLVIDRADNCINLCEIKFSEGPFTVTKKYAEELERKKLIFREQTKSRKALFTTLITPHGLTENDHSTAVVDHSITIDSLF